MSMYPENFVPVVPEYLQGQAVEPEQTTEEVNQESNEEDQEVEDLEEDPEENEVNNTDYSIYFEDILSNQAFIEANQDTIILNQETIITHLDLYDQACKGLISIVILFIIVFSGFWIGKNIFIKMM